MFMHTDSSKRLAQAIATFYAYGPLTELTRQFRFLMRKEREREGERGGKREEKRERD